MKKLIYTAIIIVIQHLTFSIQYSFAQVSNDNIGSGNCLDFDGNDYVRIGNFPIFEGMANMTLSCWFKTTSTLMDRAMVSKYFGSSGGISYVIRLSGLTAGHANYTLYTTSSFVGLESTSTINDDQWHHIAGVYDGATIYLYIDGVLDASAALTGNVRTGDEEFCIGDFYQGGPIGWGFPGQIDEVRMWNIARTQAQIQNDMCRQLVGNEPGLIGYWNMNEGTGGTVTDLTANGNDGTLQ